MNVTITISRETRAYCTEDLTALLQSIASSYGPGATVRHLGNGRYGVVRAATPGTEGSIVARLRVKAA